MLGADELRRSARSVRVAGSLAVGASVVLTARWVVGRSGRVLGWVLVATIVAGLLYPIVERLSTRMRRGLAIASVALGLVGLLGVIIGFAVDDVRRDLDRVRTIAPRSAARWEQDERLGQVLRDVRLSERVEEFLDSIPSRLVGGEGVDAVRAATTRGVAIFITVILTLFLLGFARSAIENSARRLSPRARRIIEGAFRRAHRYLVLMAMKALAVGVLVFTATRIADVPGAAVFALAAMVGSFVARVGLLVVAVPIALVDVAVHPGPAAALAVLGVGLIVQLLDWVVLHRWIEPRSLEVGSALPLMVFLVGLELWGIGGALCGLALWPLAVAVWDARYLVDADITSSPPDPAPVDLGT